MAAGEEIVAGVMIRPLLSCIKLQDNACSKGLGRGGLINGGGANGGGKDSTVGNAASRRAKKETKKAV